MVGTSLVFSSAIKGMKRKDEIIGALMVLLLAFVIKDGCNGLDFQIGWGNC